MISDPGLSKSLNGPLRYGLAVPAFIVSRLLTPAEADWKTDERVGWLQGLATVECLQLLDGRAHASIVREHLSACRVQASILVNKGFREWFESKIL